jgi:hypothetical protein
VTALRYLPEPDGNMTLNTHEDNGHVRNMRRNGNMALLGLPLFVLGSLGQLRGAHLARTITRHERLVQVVTGVALLAVGMWDLSVNLPLIVG